MNRKIALEPFATDGLGRPGDAALTEPDRMFPLPEANGPVGDSLTLPRH